MEEIQESRFKITQPQFNTLNQKHAFLFYSSYKSDYFFKYMYSWIAPHELLMRL